MGQEMDKMDPGRGAGSAMDSQSNSFACLDQGIEKVEDH